MFRRQERTQIWCDAFTERAFIYRFFAPGRKCPGVCAALRQKRGCFLHRTRVEPRKICYFAPRGFFSAGYFYFKIIFSDIQKGALKNA